MNSTYPLISCICITNNRSLLLQRAISCFESQNYPNKELVVSYPNKDQLSQEVIERILKYKELKIVKILRPNDESLGNARNNAIRKCNGDYICLWDDDDWYHPSRLSFQFNSMQIVGHGYQASILSRILLYDSTTKKAYYSFSYTWDGTILCKKEILLQNQYANANRGEDTHVITFLNSRKLLYKIDDTPFLYIYVYHGQNTWDYKHFKYFLDKSELLDEPGTKNVKMILND